MGVFSNENCKRDFTGCGHSCSPAIGQPENLLSRMQPTAEKENGPMFECDVHAGWNCLVLLALPVFGRFLL